MVRSYVDETHVDPTVGCLETDSAQIILQTSGTFQISILLACLNWQADCAKVGGDPSQTGGELNASVGDALSALSSRLLRRRNPWSEPQLVTLLQLVGRTEHLCGPHGLPITAIVSVTTRHVEEHGLAPRIRRGLNRLLIAMAGTPPHGPVRRQIERVDQILGHVEHPKDIEPSEAWSDVAIASLAQMSPDDRQAWEALIAHALLATASRPSHSWLSVSQDHIEAIGREAFRYHLVDWLSHLGQPGSITQRPDPARTFENNTLISTTNSTILRGLIWTAGLVEQTILHDALRRAAERCFDKIPTHGQRNQKLGNACVHALSQAGAIDQLNQLAHDSQYHSVRQTTQRALETAQRDGHASS
jgi:hypothetical protein